MGRPSGERCFLKRPALAESGLERGAPQGNCAVTIRIQSGKDVVLRPCPERKAKPQ